MKSRIVSINMTEKEKPLICLYYKRMGFEVFKEWDVENTNQYGVVTGSWKRIEFYFNGEQKNGKKLWDIYKQYKKRKRELETLEEIDRGGVGLSILFVLKMALFLGVILLPVFLKLLEFELDWDDIYFTLPMFSMIYMISFLCGGVITITIALILHGVFKTKRRLAAMEKIPIVQQEIEKMTIKAQMLLDEKREGK